MRMTFFGATATVTGSKTLVEVGGLKLLVDCGMFQGFKTLRERNWAPLPFDPASLDAVLLTHAHIDHSGSLPLLTRQGFKGPIWSTAATADLAEVLLQDTAHLQEEEAYFRNRHGKTRHQPAEPLYTVKDVKACLKHFKRVASDGVIDLGQGVRVRFSPAGHILGAASIAIEYQGKTALFSGDLGRDDDLVMVPPQTGYKADWVVIESTYGDRLHPAMDPIEKLGDVVRRTAARGGVVIIPAFAVGRTQGLLYALYRLKEAGAIPNIPVILDSPMGISATGLYERHRAEHRLTEAECQGIHHMTRFVRDVEESKALLRQHYPMVIIAGSGMVTGGRVLHHIEHYGPQSRNSIVLSGFQAGGTRGASLAAGETSIKLFGEYVPIRAEVTQIEGLSAHADQAGLLNWLKGMAQKPEHVFINHGEPQAADTLRLRIQEKLGLNASVPDYKDSVDLT
ncbi:MAG TPA: MBL fold metallo-hydrolase [Aquabacterium sp.]|uniref:MBL fold metallo-hydrolase n=1 Tax=Aquabacterium sp. TaxID=1872578 RepID=UPI002E3582C4|nr:MBL fold metallo-hydrolase [Aquabacterium sp.]HEX5354924.1 MBL fold metallo-hydrolase [Aquabacterium sp.]